MAERKSRQTRIGEAGIAITAQRVREMGYLYHDERVDHGICRPDGNVLNVVAHPELAGSLLGMTPRR